VEDLPLNSRSSVRDVHEGESGHLKIVWTVLGGSSESPDLVIRLVGALDSESARYFASFATGHMQVAVRWVVFDLCDLGGVALDGVRALELISDRFGSMGGHVVLAGFPPPTNKTFRDLGIMRDHVCCDTLHEAMQAIQSDPSNRALPYFARCPECLEKFKIKQTGGIKCPHCRQELLVTNDGNLVASGKAGG
jgi:anti-anti-sigma regulatory factor